MCNDSEKKKFIINELKLFSETGDVQNLAHNLNKVLVLEHQRALIEEIKPFIPVRNQALFDSLIKKPQYDNRSIIYTSIVDKNKLKNMIPPGKR